MKRTNSAKILKLFSKDPGKRTLVFTGDESDEQPFVDHKCDANNELILGDGTDE